MPKARFGLNIKFYRKIPGDGQTQISNVFVCKMRSTKISCFFNPNFPLLMALPGWYLWALTGRYSKKWIYGCKKVGILRTSPEHVLSAIPSGYLNIAMDFFLIYMIKPYINIFIKWWFPIPEWVPGGISLSLMIFPWLLVHLDDMSQAGERSFAPSRRLLVYAVPRTEPPGPQTTVMLLCVEYIIFLVP